MQNTSILNVYLTFSGINMLRRPSDGWSYKAVRVDGIRKSSDHIRVIERQGIIFLALIRETETSATMRLEYWCSGEHLDLK